MKWQEKSPWYAESDESYRISKGSEGAPGRYACWAPGSKNETPAVAYKRTMKEAMQACEDHHNDRSKK